jgi:hypothetical protein
VLISNASLNPAPHADQSSSSPPTHSGGIGQARRVLAVGRCLLGSITGSHMLTGLLSAVQGVRRRWCQPIGQDREGLPAWLANSAPHPHGFVLVVMALTQSLPVTDDRVITANGASPRQTFQGDHPGSALSSASGSAIKRITAGVRAAADRRCQVSIWGPALTLPVKSVSNEKRILLFGPRRRRSVERAFGVGIECPVSVEETDVVES